MLPRVLQAEFAAAYEDLFGRAASRAKVTKSGRPDETSWVRNFHELSASELAPKLRQSASAAGHQLSFSVGTAFLHGRPFRIRKVPPLSTGVEIADLMLVAERYRANGTLGKRQALLLQMKVGYPTGSGQSVSTVQQALLYGAWPPITWDSAGLRALPGRHPRTPTPRPCRAAQFGVVPADPASGYQALQLAGPGVFGKTTALAGELAATSRLAIGVDATPGPFDGWPRIVEDILSRAVGTDQGGGNGGSSRRADGGGPDDGDREVALAQPNRSRLLIVVIRIGRQGQLD